MADTVGQLNVELSANTAEFIEAFRSAAEASSHTKNEVILNMRAIKLAAGELDASLATGAIGGTAAISARRNIISLAEQQIALANKEGIEHGKNLSYLKAATAELEKQKNALAGGGSFSSVASQILNAIKLRAASIPGLGGTGSALTIRAYEPVGKMLEEGAGSLEEKFGGAAIAIGGVTAAVVALGAVAAEVTHHMMDLAQSIENTSAATGLTTTQVQEFKELAREMGVDAGSLEMAFARIQAQVGEFASTGSARGSGSQYFSRVLRDMGVAIEDASGSVRPAADILNDFYNSLQKIPDASSRTAIEMAALGSRGRVLAEVFEQARREGISLSDALKSIDTSGVVISPAQLENLERAKEDWDKISRAIEGAKIQASLFVAESLTSVRGAAKGIATVIAAALPVSSSAAQGLVNALFPEKPEASGSAPNQFISAVQLGQIGDLNEKLQQQLALLSAGSKEQMELKAAEDAYSKAAIAHAIALGQGNAGVLEQSKLAMGLYGEQIATLKQIIALEGAKHSVEVPKDSVSQMVEKLKEQAAAQMALADATSRGTAAMILQKGEGDADKKIAETRTALLARESDLRKELSNPGAVGSGEQARIRSQIDAVKQQLKELSSDAPQIRALYLEISSAEEGARIQGELGKETQDFSRKIASIRELASAYAQGGSAISAAQISGELEADSQKVEELSQVFGKLSPQVLAATNALSEHRSQLEKIAALNVTEEIEKQARSFLDQAAAVEALNHARLGSPEEVREAQVGVRVAQFSAAHPGATADQVATFRALMEQESAAAQESAIAQEAAQYQIGKAADDTLDKLKDIRAWLLANGKSTVKVDFAISQAAVQKAIEASREIFETKNAQLIADAAIEDAQDAQIHQWDELVEKSGTFSERMRSVLDEIASSGKNFSTEILKSMSDTVDSIEGALAKLVVTGKNSFQELFKSLAERTLKTGFQFTFSSIAGEIEKHTQKPSQPGAPQGGIGGGIAGAVNQIFGKGKERPIGTKENPMYVIETSLASAMAGSVAKGSGLPGIADIPGALAKASSKGPAGIPDLLDMTHIDIPGIPKPNDAVNTATSMASSATGILSTIKKLFGMGSGAAGAAGAAAGGAASAGSSMMSMLSFLPMLAKGGDVTPGKAYIVGEKHPEIFFPGQQGRVYPEMPGMRPKVSSTNVSINVSGVSDADSFGRSEAQIYSRAMAMANMAAERSS